MNPRTDPLKALVGAIETAEIPVQASTRQAEPNPFLEGKHFPADEKALIFTVDGPSDSALAKKLVSQARKAAQAVDRTARVKLEQSGPKSKPVTQFTVWTIARVVRPRGGSESNGTSAEE